MEQSEELPPKLPKSKKGWNDFFANIYINNTTLIKYLIYLSIGGLLSVAGTVALKEFIRQHPKYYNNLYTQIASTYESFKYNNIYNDIIDTLNQLKSENLNQKTYINLLEKISIYINSNIKLINMNT